MLLGFEGSVIYGGKLRRGFLWIDLIMKENLRSSMQGRFYQFAQYLEKGNFIKVCPNNLYNPTEIVFKHGVQYLGQV